jgi:hypothetical protein
MLTNQQEKGIEILYKRFIANEKVSILQGPAGSGKALKHGTIIPSPTGNKKIEDLKEGDIIFDRYGKPTEVKGVYPQGLVNTYKITFSDGRESYCCEDHLWGCFTSKNNIKAYKTKEMFLDYKKEQKNRPGSFEYKYKIPLAAPVDYKEKKYKIHPYLIGAFLGDGCCLERQLSISSKDDFIVEKIGKILQTKPRKQSKNNYTWQFYEREPNRGRHTFIQTGYFFEGLEDSLIQYSHLKKIPEEYKYGSIKQRYELIQGLMDTDGTVDIKGRCSFSTTSLNLAKDFRLIIHSLGMAASLRKSEREGKRPEYYIYIQASPSQKIKLFSLPRKIKRIEKYIQSKKNFVKYDKLTIQKIEKVEKDYATCISVEHEEKLFLTEDYIVTHNTTLLKFFFQELGLESHQVAFATFTGTAAKILTQKGSNAQTIHSLIYTPIMHRGICTGFRRKSREELAHLKLIVIDEFSMVSQDILDDLLYYNIPLILVGDKAQLPPIGRANSFIEMAHAELTEVHRQALDNPILWAANQIRLGEPLLNGTYDNKLLVTRRHDAEEKWFDPKVQFIAGLNDTRNELNRKIGGHELPIFDDKIIFLSNDWKNNITNGTKAIIQDFSRRGSIYYLNLELDDGSKIRNYKAAFKQHSNPRMQTFDFGYCVTCHKAQGSTIDQPGVIYDESSFFGKHRSNWMYTALTRFTGNYPVVILR